MRSWRRCRGVCVLVPLGDVAKPLDVVDGVAAWKWRRRRRRGAAFMVRPKRRGGTGAVTCVWRALADVALNWRSFALAS